MSNSKGPKTRCHVCGYRRRGSNHDRGEHHRKAEAKRAEYRLQVGVTTCSR